MRVIFFATHYFKESQTGAGTQIRETIRALRGVGDEVRVVYVKYEPVEFEGEDGGLLTRVDVQHLIEFSDVAHLIHCSWKMASIWRSFSRRIPVVGSTIYWGGRERIRIALRNNPTILSGLRQAIGYLRYMSPWCQDMREIDVILPNSFAESENVRAHFRLSTGTLSFPVNNGFRKPSFPLEYLSRWGKLPEADYIVVPGIFANRKNQLGLIRALRDSAYPVVFVGGHQGDPEMGDWYFQECKRQANDKMFFLGYVPSGSREYWSVLRYARCACLPSDCETPGIAMIEAAYAGARPVITKYGGTCEYYGFDAEYLDPCSGSSILNAVKRGWERGRLEKDEAQSYGRFSWDYCARLTRQAYLLAMQKVKNEI